MTETGVEGYTVNDLSNARHGDVCQLVKPVSASLGEEATALLLDVGPSFVVRYNDGELDLVPGQVLNPWFPV